MLQQLINLSPDIKRLSEDGYDMEVDGAYLLVHQIPYVNPAKEIKQGTIVTVLSLAGPGRTAVPQDHTVYFIGEKPCDAEGQPLISIINSSGNQQLTNTILINHYFSSKPVSGKYADFYEKIRTYAEILCAQANAIDSTASSKPLKVQKHSVDTSVFEYPDTNSARAQIDFLNTKFTEQKIGIIGLGGTGSYILDLVAKTPVKEIHLYDGDLFQLHNAFRAPGAIAGERLNEAAELFKVNYFNETYSKMHKGIIAHKEFVTTESISQLKDLDFVFVCVDSNKVRYSLATALLGMKVSFIDTGLGVNLVDDHLIGTIRVTTATPQQNLHIKEIIGEDEQVHNEYAPNIQIADLNSLNAVLAVIKWKKLSGFYQDLKQEHNSLYFINTGKILNNDLTA